MYGIIKDYFHVVSSFLIWNVQHFFHHSDDKICIIYVSMWCVLPSGGQQKCQISVSESEPERGTFF